MNERRHLERIQIPQAMADAHRTGIIEYITDWYPMQRYLIAFDDNAPEPGVRRVITSPGNLTWRHKRNLDA